MANCGANHDSNRQHYEQRHAQHRKARDRVCSSLRLRVNRRFNVRRMKAAVVSGTRGVVDARSRNSNRAGYPAMTNRQMGAAHPNG